jgi:uncharacterized protein YfiM (DUF2279 family)
VYQVQPGSSTGFCALGAACLQSPFMRQLRIRFQQSFLFRWTLANMAGWTIGLYATVFSLSWPTICLSIAIAGSSIGFTLWLVLRLEYCVGRTWIVWSILGSFAGWLPAFIIGTLPILRSVALGAAISGAVLGLAVGAGEWLAIRYFKNASWWLVANLIGGALCGVLTFTPIIPGLPLGLLLGAALFGLITGYALQGIMRQT